MKLIIHAGQPKTATTSIQYFLHYNANLLSQVGMSYLALPDRGMYKNDGCLGHRYLFHYLMSIEAGSGSQLQYENIELLREHIQPEAKDCSLETLQKQARNFFSESLRGHGCKILSEELLWCMGSFDKTSRIKSLWRFKELICSSLRQEDITIVFCLRDPRSWVESYYSQLAKTGETWVDPFFTRHTVPLGRISDFIKSLVSRSAFDYNDIIDDWRHIFSNATIKVVQYEELVKQSPDIGMSFLKSLPFNAVINNSAYQAAPRMQASTSSTLISLYQLTTRLPYPFRLYTPLSRYERRARMVDQLLGKSTYSLITGRAEMLILSSYNGRFDYQKTKKYTWTWWHQFICITSRYCRLSALYFLCKTCDLMPAIRKSIIYSLRAPSLKSYCR